MQQKILKYVYLFWIVSIPIAVIFTLLTQQPSINPRTLESTDFYTLWTRENIKLQPQSPAARPFLEIVNDCLLLVDSHNSLQCIDIQSGETHWQKRISASGTNVTSNEDLIFVSSSTRTHCATYTPQCDVIKVVAYDVLSGEIRWSNTYEGMGTVTQTSADASTLLIVGGGGHGTYGAKITIDVNTGSSSRKETSPFLASYEPSLSLPTKERIVSNTAIANDIAYFIMENTTLSAMDINTEQSLSSANFEPRQSPLTLGNLFQVAAHNNIVVVYLGDSKQLFTFRFMP